MPLFLVPLAAKMTTLAVAKAMASLAMTYAVKRAVAARKK